MTNGELSHPLSDVLRSIDPIYFVLACYSDKQHELSLNNRSIKVVRKQRELAHYNLIKSIKGVTLFAFEPQPLTIS